MSDKRKKADRRIQQTIQTQQERQDEAFALALEVALDNLQSDSIVNTESTVEIAVQEAGRVGYNVNGMTFVLEPAYDILILIKNTETGEIESISRIDSLVQHNTLEVPTLESEQTA